MGDLSEKGRLRFFAYVRAAEIHTTGDLEMVAALVVCEYPTVSQELADPGRFNDAESLLVARNDDLQWGPWRETTIYPVLELDETGREIDDWQFDELKDALDYLTSNYPSAIWEPLPDDHSEALNLIQRRLTHPHA